MSVAVGRMRTCICLHACVTYPGCRRNAADFFRILEELLCEALSAEGDGTQLSMSPGDVAKLVIASTRGIAVMRDMYVNPAVVRAVMKALLNAVVLPTAREQQSR